MMKHYFLVVAVGVPVFLLVSMFLIGVNSQPCHAQASATGRAPVLVELFTSEGCSDCPPADRLLENLDRSQPISGAEIIVISEHVDYWNRLGWTDPFSSAFYSQRQSAYADRFGISSVYTPQMVVDGATEFVGSDSRRAQSAIAEAAAKPKVALRLSSVTQEKNVISFHVEGDALPGKSSADIYVVVADNSDTSQVERGENSGRTLTHVAVAREFKQVDRIGPGSSFAKDVKLDLKSSQSQSGEKRNLRVIAFAQERGSGRVLGSAMQKLAESNTAASAAAAVSSHRR